MKYFSVIFLLLLAFRLAGAQTMETPIPKKELPKSRLELSRRTQNGSFYDVAGRRSAAFGYEHRNMEAWVYPIKILDDFALDFQIEGYNVPFRSNDLLTTIEVRPEATIFTYSHAAFTVRQIVFAPVDEPGLISLLDIKTTLPMTVGVAFRPKLRPMWPAGLMTPFVGQDKAEKYYYIGEESHKFYGIVGSPGARDTSLMPYQEEPKDIPVRYTLAVSLEDSTKNFVPIVIAGSHEGRAKAVENYQNLLKNALALYEKNVKYYEAFLDRTLSVKTPDDRLNNAFAWAKIGIEKGVATNPFLGTGLLAGFRTSGESERPGFAWYFGRDALWTAFATTSEGDFETTKTAIGFLKKYQRDDGKIPHEISQSAVQVDWWKAYPYAWNAADATPLYVIAIADYFRASGDLAFVKENWDSVLKAYKFTEATDTDGNALIENTKFGHGWIEGGDLYPPHEEIYMQGVWIEASRNLAELATVLGDAANAERGRKNAEKTRVAMEKTYWLEDRGFYGYATQVPRTDAIKAESGPFLERRQARLNELQKATIYDEETVLPAVPMWWKTLDDARAQKQLDRLASARIATDWGARILSNDSKLYDPLSYHHGSVWALFTGWQSVAAYNYGRPHAGLQALTANSLLTYSNALGYVTELLSGDFNAPFGRSSHHQIWSEAMVVSPMLRGLLGFETNDAGKSLRISPQLPADWNAFEAKNIRSGDAVFDFGFARSPGRILVKLTRRSGSVSKIEIAPAIPLDAVVKDVTVNAKKSTFRAVARGDVQFVEILPDAASQSLEIAINLTDGSDVSYVAQSLVAGAANNGLRIIRSTATKEGLLLIVEGRGGRDYELGLHSPRAFREVEGIRLTKLPNNHRLTISFPESDGYVRREFLLPFAL